MISPIKESDVQLNDRGSNRDSGRREKGTQ